MKQIHLVLGSDLKACVRTARVSDDEMDEFGHTPCGAGRFWPAAASKILEIASSSLRFSPNSGAKSSPS